MNKFIILLSFIMALFFNGCLFISPKSETIEPQIQIQTTQTTENDKKYIEKEILKESREHKNFGTFFKKYINTKAGGDCSGFVSIVNKKHSNMYFTEKDVAKFYDKSGRKSKAIFNLYSSKNLIIHKDPRVGDLIFFSNTLGKGVQKNKDKSNITHIGIVTQIAKDGTVRFVHHLSGKVTHSYMNLNEKNTHLKGKKELNSYIVRCKSSSCLAANRFSGYGKLI
ncbi:C40 family peptidase [Campylobacter sp. faydin G-140]|uniref:NlpC/P60 family protein n=1 Tax=Campylobacter anatolicus TaxID=2829105 RepID=UPI001BA3ED66|nr:NlpC/P60 family protein [Campylobacter anatolicus]MBR8465890.1 C40 family peptidase [Campylobacter anatolicus]